MTRPKNKRISLNIPGHTGRIFAMFSPYESTLCADDGSVPYFPFCQGTGNQIILSPWRQTDTTCIVCTFARW